MVSGNPTIISMLFIVHFLALICMFIGYRTREATIICWLGEMSLINRNPLVTQGGDSVCRLVCLYGIFLPLGRVWSVDSWLRKRRREKQQEKQRTSVPGFKCCARIRGFLEETSPPPSVQGSVHSSLPHHSLNSCFRFAGDIAVLECGLETQGYVMV